MKFSTLLLIILFLLITKLSYPQSYSKEEKVDYVENLLQEYSFESFNIINYLKANNFNYGLYLKNAYSESDLIFYTALLVHESTHAYGLIRMEELLNERLKATNIKFSQKEFGVNLINGGGTGAFQKGIIKNYEYTYIADSIDLLMNDCIQFCEYDVEKLVPFEKIKTLYHWPYMKKCTRFGVFSYVEEMSANLQTVKVGIDLIPFILKRLDETKDVLYLKSALTFLTSFDAYYDFNLLIAWHMLYAKEHEKEIFDELMNNTNLRITFTLLCKQYEAIKMNLTDIVQDIESKYYHDYFNETSLPEYFTYPKSLFELGFHFPLKNTDKLRGLFDQEVKSILTEFTLNDCNFDNYKSYTVDPIIDYNFPSVSDISSIEDFNVNNNHKKIVELLSSESPEIYSMLVDYYSLPRRISCPITDWKLEPIIPIDSYVELSELSANIPWAVYNLSHRYNMIKGYYITAMNKKCLDLSEGIFAYSINPQKVIVVKNTDCFESKKIAKDIPSEFRGTYFQTNLMSKDKELGSQKYGIYGLLDEFNSFYYAMRITIDLIEIYKKEFKIDIEKWLTFFGRTEMIYSSYVEYKIYLLEYLNYCRHNEIEIYDKIITNEDFKQAFFEIDYNWMIALNEYDNFKNEIRNYLSDKGLNVSESNSQIRINNMAIPVKKDYVIIGQKYMNSNKFDEINRKLDFINKAKSY